MRIYDMLNLQTIGYELSALTNDTYTHTLAHSAFLLVYTCATILTWVSRTVVYSGHTATSW